MTKKKFTLTQYKILHTVFLFEKDNLAPNIEGIRNVLRGNKNSSFSRLEEYDTFSTLTSYTDKKITNLINKLVKEEYLERRMFPDNGEFFLLLTEKGKEELSPFLKRHKKGYRQKEQEKKITFVKIDELL